jgi:hypothetical protein
MTGPPCYRKRRTPQWREVYGAESTVATGGRAARDLCDLSRISPNPH